MHVTRKLVFLTVAAALLLPMMASQAFAGDGKAALDFVPKDTMMVINVDLEGLSKTSIFKDFMAAIMAEKEVKDGLSKFKDATGFDPEKDIASLLIAVPPDVEKTENFLLIAKAKIDEKKLIAFAKQEGSKIEEKQHEGVTWYEIDKEGAMAFVNGHILIGPAGALKAAIDTQKGKMDAIKKNAKVNGMIGAVDTKANVWFAMAIPAELKKEIAAQNPMAGDLESAHASLDFGSGLKLRVTLSTASEATAKQLVELAQAGLQGAGADPQVKAMGLEPVFTKLSIKAAGKDLNVALDLTADEFATIKNMVQAMVQGGMR